MTHALWHRWTKRRPAAGGPRSGFQLTLEALEERATPAACTVTNLGDAGTGTGDRGDLRYCIQLANGSGDLSSRIEFVRGLTGTIELTRGPLSLRSNVEIVGPGADVLAVSGGLRTGVFHVPRPPTPQEAHTVRISDLTVTEGTGVSPTGRDFNGGGLLNEGNHVTLTRTVFAGNQLTGEVAGSGGAIAHFGGTMTIRGGVIRDNVAGAGGGGVINNNATMTITDTVIEGNTARDDGGISNIGDLTITRSVLAGNSAPQGAGAISTVGSGISLTVTHSVLRGNAGQSAGAIYSFGGRVTLTDTLVEGNYATGGAGGVTSFDYLAVTGSTFVGNWSDRSSGAIETNGGAELVNSTLSGNYGEAGGGVTVTGSLGLVMLTSCTVTGNYAAGESPDLGGGGIFVLGVARAVVRNTIVAGNAAASEGPDVRGGVISAGYNLVGQRDASSGWTSTDRLGTSANPLDPRLAPLDDYGGPTPTHALLVGSPAIQTGDNALQGTTDQRGSEREVFSRPDVGAFNAGRAFHFRVEAPEVVRPGVPFAVTFTALDQWGNRATTYTGRVHFSSTDFAAVLPPDSAFTANDLGVGTFTFTLHTLGVQGVRAAHAGVGLPSGNATVRVEEGPPMDSDGAWWADLVAVAEVLGPRRRP